MLSWSLMLLMTCFLLVGIAKIVTQTLHSSRHCVKLSKWSKSVQIRSCGFTTNYLVLRSSGRSSIISSSLREGLEVADCWSHCGPYQHSCIFSNFFCVTPKEMKSARFSQVGTRFQSLTLVVSWIRATILATNLFYLVAGGEIHDQTIVESDGRCLSPHSTR